MSSDLALRVRGLSKRYEIGAERRRYTSLRDRIAGGVGDLGRRLIGQQRPGGPTTTMWALEHVSFDVRRGEVLGIIGGNGAGKSTLLKILSRITEPTDGEIEIHGRVGSLLEVGTGFHPDLTGRENIFLNGAILGMGRSGIDRKFDEIVAFAEVDRFLETPVRHYSSGMYVRLAFAVAAFMEPEILVVDEVLAVGDASFQRKCLGKMDDVGRSGRTILFVSHNMAAIQRLCTTALLLDGGRLVRIGDVRSTVAAYLGGNTRSGYRAGAPTGRPQVLSADLVDAAGGPLARPLSTDPIVCRLRYVVPVPSPGLRVGIGVLDVDGEPLFTTNTDDAGMTVPTVSGTYVARIAIPPNTLLAGDFHLATCLWNDATVLDLQEPALSFSVDAGASELYRGASPRKGVVHVDCGWTLMEAEPRSSAGVPRVIEPLRRAARRVGRAVLGREPETVIDHLMRSDRRSGTFCAALEYVNYEVVRGDVVEFGVFTGISLALLAQAHLFDTKGVERQMVGFDSFEGLPGSDDAHARWRPGDCGTNHAWHPLLKLGERVTPETTRALFQACRLPPPTLHVGPFAETLPAAFPDQHPEVALVHFDCDLYESTRDALHAIAPSLRDGAMLLFDDWFHYRGRPDKGEARAFHEFLAQRPEWRAVQYRGYGTFCNSFILYRV